MRMDFYWIWEYKSTAKEETKLLRASNQKKDENPGFSLLHSRPTTVNKERIEDIGLQELAIILELLPARVPKRKIAFSTLRLP